MDSNGKGKHWRRKWQPTPVFLPGESQGRGSLVGCHLWGRTEWDTTEAPVHSFTSPRCHTQFKHQGYSSKQNRCSFPAPSPAPASPWHPLSCGYKDVKTSSLFLLLIPESSQPLPRSLLTEAYSSLSCPILLIQDILYLPINYPRPRE